VVSSCGHIVPERSGNGRRLAVRIASSKIDVW
jgi:hypothetical protein